MAFAQTDQLRFRMRAIALFLVFGLGRILMLAGRQIDFDLWAAIAFIWQDVTVVLLFAGFDRLVRNRAIGWSVYVVLTLYVALNVPLVRVLSTPMTPALSRAASGPLTDSIRHHLTGDAILTFSAVVLSATLIPIVLKKWAPELSKRTGTAGVAVSLIVVSLGPTASTRVETHGLERNVVIAYLSGLRPRVASEVSNSDWRRSLAPSGDRPAFDWLRGAVQGRNIVLVGLESTGARHLRAWGAAADPTPNLTALATDALVFENAYAVYPESIKGLFSVLCSRYPAFDVRAEDYEAFPASSVAGVFRSRGYHTGLFHSGHFEYLGMEEVLRERGFGVMRDAGDISGRTESSFGVDEFEVVAALLAWVDELPADERFFVQYLPIAGHHPYLYPGEGPFEGGSEIDRYHNALHYGDRALGDLLEGFKQRGLFSNTCFVVYGDHGEAFGEHEGNVGHTLFLYEENVRVPLLIAAPGKITEGKRIPGVTSLIDIAPTLCELAAVPIPADFQGSSVLGGVERISLFYTDYSLGLLGLRDGPWKFIYELESGRRRLYNLTHDPDEMRNMAGALPSLAEHYSRRVQGWAASERGRFESVQLLRPEE